MDATKFVRAEQRREGYEDCFRKGRTCNRVYCGWYKHCWTKPPDDYVQILHDYMTTGRPEEV